MNQAAKLAPALLVSSVLFVNLYIASYAIARMMIFHAVEHYAGAEFKGLPRQDYITKVDQPPGEGWEYWLFLPAIKAEEALRWYVQAP